jgi:hypothetical protein
MSGPSPPAPARSPALRSVLLAARCFQQSNHAELRLLACIIVALGNGALLVSALWWWS